MIAEVVIIFLLKIEAVQYTGKYKYMQLIFHATEQISIFSKCLQL